MGIGRLLGALDWALQFGGGWDVGSSFVLRRVKGRQECAGVPVQSGHGLRCQAASGFAGDLKSMDNLKVPLWL